MTLLSEGLGVDPQRVSFQKANVFKFDFARDFWFGKPVADSNARLFVHDAESAQNAQELYSKLLDELGFDLEVVTQNEDHSILLHGFLKNYFAVGVSDGWVFGIENAETETDATAAIDRFTQTIDGEN